MEQNGIGAEAIGLLIFSIPDQCINGCAFLDMFSYSSNSSGCMCEGRGRCTK